MRLSSWRITTTTSSPAWTWTRSTWRSTRTWWGWGKECMLIMLRRGGIDFLRGQILRGKHLDCGRDCPRLPNSWIPVHKYKAAAVPADPWRRFVQLLPAAQSCWEFAGNYLGAGVWLWSSSELSHGQQFLWETQFFEGNKWIRLRFHRSCKSDLMGDVKKIWGWYRKCSQNRGTDISVKKLFFKMKMAMVIDHPLPNENQSRMWTSPVSALSTRPPTWLAITSRNSQAGNIHVTSFLRDGWPYKNGWIFGKIPNGL